ncbi:hypothetical protein BGZ81_003806 [Podila clonocystis]|nr:hypothetical protein BGZ81_003806 [Podila clonocystis]
MSSRGKGNPRRKPFSRPPPGSPWAIFKKDTNEKQETFRPGNPLTLFGVQADTVDPDRKVALSGYLDSARSPMIPWYDDCNRDSFRHVFKMIRDSVLVAVAQHAKPHRKQSTISFGSASHTRASKRRRAIDDKKPFVFPEENSVFWVPPEDLSLRWDARGKIIRSSQDNAEENKQDQTKMPRENTFVVASSPQDTPPSSLTPAIHRLCLAKSALTIQSVTSPGSYPVSSVPGSPSASAQKSRPATPVLREISTSFQALCLDEMTSDTQSISFAESHSTTPVPAEHSGTPQDSPHVVPVRPTLTQVDDYLNKAVITLCGQLCGLFPRVPSDEFMRFLNMAKRNLHNLYKEQNYPGKVIVEHKDPRAEEMNRKLVELKKAYELAKVKAMEEARETHQSVKPSTSKDV